MRIITYDDRYRLSLADMLCDYFKEVHPNEYTGNPTIAEHLCLKLSESSRTAYLLLDDKNLPVGFMIGYLNDQFGMVRQALVVEYQYIKPSNRSSMAIAHLYDMVGRICEDCECGTINSTFIQSSNIGNLQKLGAKAIAITTYLSQEEVAEKHIKYKRRIDR